MRERMHGVSILLCAALLAATSVQAQTRRSGGGAENQQLRMLQQQNATLTQENSALGAERDALKAESVKLHADNDVAQQAVKKSKDEYAAVVARLNDLLGQHSSLRAQEKTTVEKLKAVEHQGQDLQSKLDEMTRQNGICEAGNRKLYQLNVELLERYKKKSVFDAVLQHEPLTGLKDVEMQNIIQKYRDEIDAQRIPEAAATGKPINIR
jgi:chromosome segregation ATPase